MTTSVRLKCETKERLKRVADMTGKSVSKVIQEAVDEHCDNVLKPQDSEDAWAEYIGAFDSGGKSDASRISEVFGEILKEKKRAGRL